MSQGGISLKTFAEWNTRTPMLEYWEHMQDDHWHCDFDPIRIFVRVLQQ